MDLVLYKSYVLYYVSDNEQILPSDWLSYSLSIGYRPLVARAIDLHIQNNGRKLTFNRGFSSFLQHNILSD